MEKLNIPTGEILRIDGRTKIKVIRFDSERGLYQCEKATKCAKILWIRPEFVERAYMDKIAYEVTKQVAPNQTYRYQRTNTYNDEENIEMNKISEK